MTEEFNKVFNTEGDSPEVKVEPKVDQPEVKVNALGKAWALDEAANKIEHAESHIKTLEEELATLKSKSDEAVKFEDVLKAIQDKDNKETEPTSTVKPEDLVQQTLSVLEQKERERIAEGNFKEVEQLMKQKYGEDYVSKVAEESQARGLSPDALDSLMKSSPLAVKTLFGLEDKSPTPAPTSTSVNTVALGLNNEEAALSAKATEAKSAFISSRKYEDLANYFQSKQQLRNK